jgi:hypothetical protein
MDIRPQPETPPDVPEADALEQQTPVQPESLGVPGETEPLPDNVSEADALEQRADTHPGGLTGYTEMPRTTETDAAEADLVEQSLAPPTDDDEDYPDAHDEAL